MDEALATYEACELSLAGCSQYPITYRAGVAWGGAEESAEGEADVPGAAAAGDAAADETEGDFVPLRVVGVLTIAP